MSPNHNITLKTIKFSVLFLFFPLIFWGQTLTGLWTGIFKSNSDTIRKDQSFEIALTEYKGKVYGYSRSEFIINDTLYYIVKRVKGTITGDSCEVKDDEILSYNFRGRLDKGVKVISVFRMNKKDSTWHLDGNWKTTTTKRFYSITGKIKLQEQKDFTQSALLPDLEELNLAKDVAFYQEQKQKKDFVSKEQSSRSKDLVLATDKKQPEVVSSLSETKINESKIQNKKEDSALVKTESSKNNQPAVQLSKSEDLAGINNKNLKVEKNSELAKQKELLTNSKDSITAASISKNTKKQTEVVSSLSTSKKPELVIQNKKKDSTLAKTALTKNNQSAIQLSKTKDLVIAGDKKQPEEKLLEPVKIKESKANDKDSFAIHLIAKNDKPDSTLIKKEPRKKELTAAIISPEIKKDNPLQVIANNKIKTEGSDISKPAAFASERKSEISQTINFKSDSLELVLYDNGEVDGDTVSILMNGKVIIPKQGLLAVAFKKKIYIPKNSGDSVILTMYAENLGKYPPNTGLLIIHDGNDSYNVYFTADLQTNAAVILKRKRSQ